MGTINSLQYLIWLKSKAIKIYLVVQSVKLLLALSIYRTNFIDEIGPRTTQSERLINLKMCLVGCDP